MSTPDGIQHAIIQALNPHAHAPDPVTLQHGDVLWRKRFRGSFHRMHVPATRGHFLKDGLEDPGEEPGREGGGSAAAHVQLSQHASLAHPVKLGDQ